MKYVLGMAVGIFLLLIPSLNSVSQGVQWDPKLIASSDIQLEKSIVYMHIPADNKLPFGCVWGKVIDAVPGYPVVVQIYQNGKPVYFAQVDVKNDGSYEHYFRIKSVDGNNVINVFQGDYTVNIFKTVYVTTAPTIT
ncbi:MAG TPA: hypothetical protein VFG24_04335 [Nitrosopumilaceae archaeon]|nr:hypothetical protein [Nitrosopumilaceae archaeon]